MNRIRAAGEVLSVFGVQNPESGRYPFMPICGYTGIVLFATSTTNEHQGKVTAHLYRDC
ncbi:MAG: hypothetical protein Q8891_16615 [Bacteroidota bacterium]|nr:hypothetical protein [Bacteroidota bacterium]